jgi:hypothetical protein
LKCIATNNIESEKQRIFDVPNISVQPKSIIYLFQPKRARIHSHQTHMVFGSHKTVVFLCNTDHMSTMQIPGSPAAIADGQHPLTSSPSFGRGFAACPHAEIVKWGRSVIHYLWKSMCKTNLSFPLTSLSYGLPAVIE